MSNIITGCYDSGCPDHEQCARWLERSECEAALPSMFPYDLPIGETCYNLILVARPVMDIDSDGLPF